MESERSTFDTLKVKSGKNLKTLYLFRFCIDFLIPSVSLVGPMFVSLIIVEAGAKKQRKNQKKR